MKLYYYSGDAEFSNFGDDLNPWLWKRIIPELFDDDPEVLFLGIGTLLSDRVPKARQKIVFGSGVGYGKYPTIDESWKIYCLRGPLTAKALGVPADAAVIDPAVLVRRCFKPSGLKKTRFAYMPHWIQAAYGGVDWLRVCGELGLAYIDPRRPVEEVMGSICETEILLTEAMHGAIIADSFRVPWIPVCSTERILSFKWRDWCASVGLEYRPYPIRGLLDPPAHIENDPRAPMRWIKRKWAKVARLAAPVNLRLAAEQLARISAQPSPLLSDRKVFDRLSDLLEEKLQEMREDVAARLVH